MWSPTHVQVLVKRAKGLNVKGKNGTNDAFVTISLGKEKFQTSVREKSGPQAEWSEQCELSIPSQGNTAEVTLTVFHRNFLGVDEFLGQVSLPLREFDVYERPRSKWHPLKCKPGKNKTEYRGELEVKLGFTVKASTTVGNSTADLAKKNKGSVASITKAVGNFGGSLASITSKEKKNIKSIAKSVKEKVKDKTKKNSSSLKLNKEKGGLGVLREHGHNEDEDAANEDPGVNSDNEEEDEFKFETISQPSPAASISRREPGELSQFARTQQELSRTQQEAPSASSSRSSTLSRPNPPATLSVSRTSSGRSRKEENQEWDAKLLGKPAKEEAKETGKPKVKGSQSSLPSYNEATEEPAKKKIIPVQSDFESSPSPEDPSSPLPSPPLYHKNRFRMSQSTMNLARHDSGELERKKKSLGLKLKTSYSSLLDLSKYGKGKGFVRERPDAPIPDLRRNSVESNNSRTYSDTSMGPPNGARVVLGRETSPSPDLNSHRLPHDVLSRFNGKTREDLIEMVVALQGQVDHQGRKIGDLEDYIDNMLIRILEVAPILLKKPSPVLSKGRHIN